MFFEFLRDDECEDVDRRRQQQQKKNHNVIRDRKNEIVSKKA